MQNQALHRQNTQSGNALWYILIAIALIAALTYTLTRNSSKMATNLSDEQASIVAAQVARTFASIGQGVQKVMTQNGCSENELNFQSTAPNSPSFANPSSPSDKHCHIFEPEGAGLTNVAITPGVLDHEDFWNFSGDLSVNGVGPENATQTVCASNCAELMMIVQGIDEAVCRAYDRMIGLNGGEPPIEADNISPTYFTGSYGQGILNARRISTGTGDSTSLLYGWKTGCVAVGGSAPYSYQLYYTLLAR